MTEITNYNLSLFIRHRNNFDFLDFLIFDEFIQILRVQVRLLYIRPVLSYKLRLYIIEKNNKLLTVFNANTTELNEKTVLCLLRNCYL